VVGGACLVSRGNVGAAELGVDRYEYLLEYQIPSWPAVNCPLCLQQVPVNPQYAHGAEFLANHPPA
jgi:orotate phosphoribosyltransferase